MGMILIQDDDILSRNWNDVDRLDSFALKVKDSIIVWTTILYCKIQVLVLSTVCLS